MFEPIKFREEELLQFSNTGKNLLNILNMKGKPKKIGAKVAIELPGGLVFNEEALKQGDAVTKFIDSKGLSSVHRWGDACIHLLRGDKQTSVPYQSGKVTLSRVGKFGKVVLIRPDLPAHVSGELPQFQAYWFEDFCLAVRSALKSLSPLAETYLKWSSAALKKVTAEESSEFQERENIIKAILQPQRIQSTIETMKRLLTTEGTIYKSKLPEKHKAKQDKKLERTHEAQSMMSFLSETLVKDQLAQANEQARQLSLLATAESKQRETERNAAWVLRKKK